MSLFPEQKTKNPVSCPPIKALCEAKQVLYKFLSEKEFPW
jgi:hypothetical protein